MIGTRKKKPRELLKANKLWNDARRHNSRHHLISNAAARCRSLDARINKISRELRDQLWSNRGELEKQMEHFELSVGQRQIERFRIQVLNSPVGPPKPHKLPRPAARKKLAVNRENNDEDVLASDSDDGLDQFIVDDEVEQVPPEESNPFNIEGIALGSLFEFDQQVDTEHSREKMGGHAAVDEPMEKDQLSEEDTDGNTSSPAEDDPMDVDQGPLVETDGNHSHPRLGRCRICCFRWCARHPCRDAHGAGDACQRGC